MQDAYYYVGTGAPPEAQQQAYLGALARIGYSLVTKQIKTIFDPHTGESKQKANLDVEIVLDMFNTVDTYDMAVLVSGDGDFERGAGAFAGAREEVQGHCHVGPRREGDPLRLRHALRGLRGHQRRG